MFFRLVSNEKNNVCVCWVVLFRDFISENIEIITSDKKRVSPKANIPLPAPFKEIELVLPRGKRGFPAQPSLSPRESVPPGNFAQPESGSRSVCFS